MENLDFQFTVGEVKRLAVKAAVSDDGSGSPTTFSVSSVTCNIYDSTGSAVVTAGSGGVDDADPAAEHEVYYLWTPSTAGRYTFKLFGVVGTQTILMGEGTVTVLAATSKFDKWVNRVLDWMRDSKAGDAQQLLSDAQLRDAVTTAVREYSRFKPRRLLVTKTLTANDWDYALSTDFTSWEEGFSWVVEFEYPVDATTQSRSLLKYGDYEFSVPRDEWRFVNHVPSTGQVAKITYTAPHSLTDAADTVPTVDFDRVAQYAAGVALLQAANGACGTEGQGIGADVVNYRSKQQEYSSQARRMMEDGRKSWRVHSWSL